MRRAPHHRLVAAALAAAAVAAGVTSTGAVASAATGPADGQHAAAASPGGTTSRFLVRLASDADLDAVRTAVSGGGGRVVAVQRALATVVVAGPADLPAALEKVPGVRAVSPDSRLRATSLGFDPATQAGAMTNVTRITGATQAWRSGWTGAGVDVALIDSGVAPVPALQDATKVVVGPDLSFESQKTELRYLDSYGHGTHMGGIIAGRETPKASGSTYAADTTNFYGMAPDARLVSLKLADHDGAVDVSQVIAAIDWVIENRRSNGLDIRVLNLSYGTISGQDWSVDPLSWAAEVAWRSGIVVVAAAGNDGAATQLANPAYNPWVLAVGAADTRGTDTRSDDTVANFSSWPATSTATSSSSSSSSCTSSTSCSSSSSSTSSSSSVRGVDLVAPGVGIVSPAAAGAGLTTRYPGAAVGNGFLRGSGTSQATAVVSGAVALLLQRKPTATPDTVKAVLRLSASRLSAATPFAQGSGEINVPMMMSLADYTFPPQSLPRGSGTGSLDAARGGVRLTMDGVELSGEQDVMGQPWDARARAAATAAGTAWSNDGSWNGVQWTSGVFATDTTTWAGKTWSGKTWSGKTWSGKTWSGKTWSASGWTGSGWSSASWPSSTAVTGLTGSQWAGSAWR